VQKTSKQICMKCSDKIGNGPMNKWFNFGGDPSHRVDGGIVFRICHYWEIRKVVNGHSFIPIRQMVALVRRALAEVCTFPVLLVFMFSLCCRVSFGFLVLLMHVCFCVLVHGQVTIIFIVSVCLSGCLFVCAEFFSAVFYPISIKLGHVLYVWV